MADKADSTHADPTRDEPAGEPFQMPLTTSHKALLRDGSDHQFRKFLYDLSYLGTLLDSVRRQLAADFGVTPPQYTILMVLAENRSGEELSVGEVAAHLHVSGAFVTVESGKLSAAGLVEKVPNPADKRGILLRLTPEAEVALGRMAERIRAFNDRFFAAISAKDLDRLGLLIGRMIEGGEEALRAHSSAEVLTRPGRHRARTSRR